MSVKITDQKFVFDGKGYFRGAAEDLVLCTFGEKKTPLGKPTYVSVQGKVNATNLSKCKPDVTGPWSIAWSKFSDTDVNVGIKYLTLAGGQSNFSRKRAEAADLKLIKINLGETTLKNMLNKHADIARNSLKEEGNDGRIVSAVWIVMEGALASKITTGGSVAISAPIGTTGFTLSVGATSSSKVASTVQIPENTTFAYLLQKVKKWDKQGGEWFVENLEDDTPGLT